MFTTCFGSVGTIGIAPARLTMEASRFETGQHCEAEDPQAERIASQRDQWREYLAKIATAYGGSVGLAHMLHDGPAHDTM